MTDEHFDDTIRDDDLDSAGTVAEAIQEMLRDDELAYDYLATDFVAAAILGLSAARRDAGLTQRQIAEQLGTHQSAVARWENDIAGRISLANYVRFSQALGKLPYHLVLEDIERIRQFRLAVPEKEPTQSTFLWWDINQKFHAALAEASRKFADASALTSKFSGSIEGIRTTFHYGVNEPAVSSFAEERAEQRRDRQGFFNELRQSNVSASGTIEDDPSVAEATTRRLTQKVAA